MFLLTVPIVKKSQSVAGICFIFLKKNVQDQIWNLAQPDLDLKEISEK